MEHLDHASPNGILVSGTILPDTEWCQRDERLAWWHFGMFGTRARSPKVDLLVGHWTAGEAGVDSYEDDGPRVVQAMKSRMSRRKPGQRLQVSASFVIGACAEDDEYAPVWQCMDIGKQAAVHVGRGEINARSIGVEIVSAGLPGRLDTRGRPSTEVELLGRGFKVLEFYPGQLRSWERLADALSDESLHQFGIQIPRRVPRQKDGSVLGKRMTLRELRDWSGAMEHFHMDNTTKLDAGSMLMQHLSMAGWE